MSPLNASLTQDIDLTEDTQSDAAIDHAGIPEGPTIDQLLNSVDEAVAPVWPLKDYVAVNPYMGFAGREFLEARRYLRTVSDLELFMPVDYYRQQFHGGAIARSDIAAAVDELVEDGVEGAENIDVNQVIAFLSECPIPGPTADAEFVADTDESRALHPVLLHVDKRNESDWFRTICEEISKHCASHFDQGQASWSPSNQESGLYDAWLAVQKHDLTMEVLGIKGFRKHVENLPSNPRIAIGVCLAKLGMPKSLWKDYLLCLVFSLPGWSAWCKYQQRKAGELGSFNDDLFGLLAIWLSYEVAIYQMHREKTNLTQVDWEKLEQLHDANLRQLEQPNLDELSRYALLRASEIAYRDRTIRMIQEESVEQGNNSNAKLFQNSDANTGQESSVGSRRLAQMVFCIDVRSERIRRHFEAVTPEIETLGFAGFFGLPIEFRELGASEGQANLPVLLTPKFRVSEGIDSENAHVEERAIVRRGVKRMLKDAWQDFKSSSVSMFGFVETSGLYYGWEMLARTFGRKKSKSSRFDGVDSQTQGKLAPSLRQLDEQGIGSQEQADMAEAILRGIGIVEGFARLVVFCGHGSQVENNPLKAGLDCGACGGHSGEPNARFAAKLLNQASVRTELSSRGIDIPSETLFAAALHNTTTDEITFFDEHVLPPSHQGDLAQLNDIAKAATERTKQERLPSLNSTSSSALDVRSTDWSEVRPEWGLAGNAAFIAAPRDLTKQISLDGRSFLHSYDYRNDSEFATLEQIMTAPMVVANWINMQYYASTTDPIHFGSGNKTLHNVTGKFGVLSGNGGDLQTGLPWQSVHDGNKFVHHPLRLLVIVAAPRKAVNEILDKHTNVSDLVSNRWLQLVAYDEGDFYRHSGHGRWERLGDGTAVRRFTEYSTI